jgi:hypothetical protein
LAHASLVTTDLGVTLFIFGTVYFLWRYTQAGRWLDVGGLLLCFMLAHLSKFSALLLWPIVLTLLAPWVMRPAGGKLPADLRSRPVRGGVAVAIVVVALVLVGAGFWASYGFRYTPTATPEVEGLVPQPASVAEHSPWLAAVLGTLDRLHLLPNACAQGMLQVPVISGARWPQYLAGQVSEDGWWYYFPLAIAIKTPLALLILAVAGAVVAGRWRQRCWDFHWWVVTPIAWILGSAMLSGLGLGVRHVLPIYPFILLLAAQAVAWLLSQGRRHRIALAALMLLGFGELAAVHPHHLSFFNILVGGPAQGHRWLLDSNLDWGQDLKRLKNWMAENNVPEINLAYAGSADPTYYGIRHVPLPGSPVFERDQIAAPVLPGFVAVSQWNLHGGSFAGPLTGFYRPLLDAQPVAEIGYTIRVYWVEAPWWRRPAAAASGD